MRKNILTCHASVTELTDTKPSRVRQKAAGTSIPVPQKLIGLIVAGYLLGLRVEAQRPAETVRCIGQVDQGTGNMPFFDGRVQVFFHPAANAINEVREMIALGVTPRGPGC